MPSGVKEVTKMEATSLSSTIMDNNIKSIDDFPSDHIWNETIEFPALRVPVQATARVRQQLKSMLWRHTRGRPNIYPDPQQPNDYRILILQQQQQQQQTNEDGEKEEEEENNQQQQQQQRLIQQVLEQNKDIMVDDIQKTTFTIDFTYDDYTVEQAMRKILPNELHAEIPCSYESVGPIAHINLRSAYEPFKFWIGKILLDKNQPRIHTVVTKIGTIDNEYRTFGMQIIAQRHDAPNNSSSNGNNSNNNNNDDNNDWSIVTVKEEKCTFTLDFQKVYWNSRLAGEHRRMVQEIQKYATAKRRQQRQPQQAACLQSTAEQQQQQQQQQQQAVNNTVVVVADLMAGVGPFAIPLTAPASVQKKKKNTNKKMCPKQTSHEENHHQLSNNNNNHNIIIRVYANDLNPDSFKYLKINAQQNKCHAQDLICSNQDARALLAQLQKDKIVIDHVIMNLPASAPEFLDMFRGYNNNTNTTSSVAALSTGDDVVSTLPPPPLESQEQDQKQPAAAQSSSSCLLPRIHVYCFAPKPASQIQGEQTKKACTHDDDNSTNTSSHDPTDFNQTSRSKSGAAVVSTTANSDDHHHDYQESLDRCAKALGVDSLDRKRDAVHIHVVRDVSPQKNMICISFRLPLQVTTLPSVVSFQRPAVVTKTAEHGDDDDSGISNGIQTAQPKRKGVVDDDADDDKRKRSLDPNANTTCTELMAETDPNKRSKGHP